jgi:hypothetical protein
MLFCTEIVLSALLLLTEIVLSAPLFCTEIVLTALLLLTEIVLTALMFLTEIVLTILTFLTQTNASSCIDPPITGPRIDRGVEIPAGTITRDFTNDRLQVDLVADLGRVAVTQEKTVEFAFTNYNTVPVRLKSVKRHHRDRIRILYHGMRTATSASEASLQAMGTHLSTEDVVDFLQPDNREDKDFPVAPSCQREVRSRAGNRYSYIRCAHISVELIYICCTHVSVVLECPLYKIFGQ